METYDPLYELTCRVAAMDMLLKRLLASHAQMHPDGVAARMIADPEGVIRSVEGRGDLDPEQISIMQHQLAMTLRDVRDLVEGRAQPTRMP